MKLNEMKELLYKNAIKAVDEFEEDMVECQLEGATIVLEAFLDNVYEELEEMAEIL